MNQGTDCYGQPGQRHAKNIDIKTAGCDDTRMQHHCRLAACNRVTVLAQTSPNSVPLQNRSLLCDPHSRRLHCTHPSMAELLGGELQAAIHVAQHPAYCIVIKIWNTYFTCLYLHSAAPGNQILSSHVCLSTIHAMHSVVFQSNVRALYTELHAMLGTAVTAGEISCDGITGQLACMLMVH